MLEEKHYDSGLFFLTELNSKCQSYKVLDQALFYVSPCKRAIDRTREVN